MDSMENDGWVAPERKKHDWWQRGRAFDLWSIPHFLFGVLAGMISPLTGISLLTAFALTLLLALVWELYEKIVGIKETPLNIVSDVVLSIVAFTSTSLVLRSYPLHPDDLLVIAVAILTLYLFTNISGWLAYRRRQHDFMH